MKPSIKKFKEESIKVFANKISKLIKLINNVYEDNKLI